MTYSIIARNPDTKEIGIAVASRFFACGALVPWLSGTAAVATQAFVSPLWGVEGLARLEGGEAPEAVLADFVRRDAGASLRQAHFMAPDGRMVQHTGSACVPWAGHASASNVSVAGNMLAGPAVVADTLAAYLDQPDLPMAERLLCAMAAGEAAGGDKRGRQAAGLIVYGGQPYPFIDIRADDHADPLSELRRLLAVSAERYAMFRETMPTTDSFSGMVDRGPLDRAIAADEACRKAQGIASQSHATPLA